MPCGDNCKAAGRSHTTRGTKLPCTGCALSFVTASRQKCKWFACAAKPARSSALVVFAGGRSRLATCGLGFGRPTKRTETPIGWDVGLRHRGVAHCTDGSRYGTTGNGCETHNRRNYDDAARANTRNMQLPNPKADFYNTTRAESLFLTKDTAHRHLPVKQFACKWHTDVMG